MTFATPDAAQSLPMELREAYRILRNANAFNAGSGKTVRQLAVSSGWRTGRLELAFGQLMERRMVNRHPTLQTYWVLEGKR